MTSRRACRITETKENTKAVGVKISNLSRMYLALQGKECDKELFISSHMFVYDITFKASLFGILHL